MNINVLKHHTINKIKQNCGSCYFVSVRGKLPTSKCSIAYVQKYENVLKNPDSEVINYAKLFQLKEHETVNLISHMRVWKILRQCCGTQSSIYHRSYIHLKSRNITDYSIYSYMSRYRKELDSSCEIYNISEVENTFIHNHLTQTWLRNSLSIPIEYERKNFVPGYCLFEDKKIYDDIDFNDVKFKFSKKMRKKFNITAYK